MALKTKCLTPGADFHTAIDASGVIVKVDLPFKLDLSEKEAKILERLLHNQLELVLRPYWENVELYHGYGVV